MTSSAKTYQIVDSAPGPGDSSPASGANDSQIAATGDAFEEKTSPGSTLSVAANAYLLSMSEGAGATLYDFKTVTVNGLVAGYDPTYAGLATRDTTTTNALAVTVGASGEIYGGDAGVSSYQIDEITNAGLIIGDAGYGVYEFDAVAGANSLTNSASGQVVGGDYGLFFGSASLNTSQAIVNSGLIEGQSVEAILLNQTGANTISNAAAGRILGGEVGIAIENAAELQTITNSGLIEGYDDDAIYLAGNIGITTVSKGVTTVGGVMTVNNKASGRLTGESGIYGFELTGTVTINNAGLLEGVLAQAVALQTVVGAISITNAANAQIYGDDGSGVYLDDGTGAATIANAGLIEGVEDDAATLEFLTGPMTVSNAATGQIIGSVADGIDIEYSKGTVAITNRGFIEGEAGVYVENDSSTAVIGHSTFTTTITNFATGNITGEGCGLYFQGVTGAQSISNSGLLSGESNAGVYVGDSGATTITNATSGVIKGVDFGVKVYSTSSAAFTLANAGVIAGTIDYGVYVDTNGGDGSVTNEKTGTITGETGIEDDCASSSRTIANYGSIVGSAGDGIEEYTSGTLTLTNYAGGRVLGSDNGIKDEAGAGTRTISNSGFVQGEMVAASMKTLVATTRSPTPARARSLASAPMATASKTRRRPERRRSTITAQSPAPPRQSMQRAA